MIDKVAKISKTIRDGIDNVPISLCKLPKSSNALSFISNTSEPSSIVSPLNDLQDLNARLPILLILFGNINFWCLYQHYKKLHHLFLIQYYYLQNSKIQIYCF